MLQHKPTPGTERFGSDHETVSTHVTTCPTCDATVVDGQGLLACTDCDWAGYVG
ncbi:hypothetical protein [Halorientalis persicus]|jgi:hypothetical protein|uniref:hypothetical protein n=1 Tax=Halorientalis persicus TaxID=1367881 RepID=UPI00147E9947|nr:hypothetical protein [Halorientalis persicus]